MQTLAKDQSKEGKKKLDRFYQVVSSTLKGSRHEPLLEGSTTLYLGSVHPNRAVRLMALKQLHKETLENVRLVSRSLEPSSFSPGPS
jgi:hypothetical protein